MDIGMLGRRTALSDRKAMLDYVFQRAQSFPVKTKQMPDKSTSGATYEAHTASATRAENQARLVRYAAHAVPAHH